MDIGKAFGFVFQDPRWVSKILIGGLVLLIPIVNFAVYGYSLKVAENVTRGDPQPLPEWSDFGDHFIRGLYYFVITLVYQIPTIILSCIFAFVIGGLGAAVDSSNSDAAASGLAGFALCFYPLIILSALIFSLATYPALARYIASGNLSEGLKFGDALALLRSHFGAWIILLLVAIIASFVGSLGAIACGVGALFTLFYAQCVNGHALGQTMNKLGLSRVSDFTSPIAPTVPPATYQ